MKEKVNKRINIKHYSEIDLFNFKKIQVKLIRLFSHLMIITYKLH